MGIPCLIKLLNNANFDVRLATFSALTKLADHGELAFGCPDIADAGMKSSCARKSGAPFHHLLQCSMTVTSGFDWLQFLRLPNSLTTVSLYLDVINLDIADAGMKSNFARKLGGMFHCSLSCWMTLTFAFDRLPFLQSSSWLIMVSLYLHTIWTSLMPL